MASIGIDLGTTNTVIAAVTKGFAVTLEDERGFRLLPSIVSFDPSGDVLVGFGAKERRITDAENTVYSVKRLIGRAWNSADVVQARTRFPFKLVEGPKRTVNVIARGQQYAMPEISAFVLRRARQMAEKALGETVDSAVITVPANFNDLQRASTKVAGRLAGLEVLRILNEPTAAALAYGQTQTQSERIAVFDLGGGTFDITILDLSGDIFEVLTTSGDTSLGGDDLDMALANHLSEIMKTQVKLDPRNDAHAFGTLCIIAEYIKTQLSTEVETTFEIRDLSPNMRLTFPVRVTRAELETIATAWVDRTLSVTRNCLIACNLVPRDVDRVIMVGGSTRMPLVTAKVGEFFGKQPDVRVNPDEVVALGAAIQAHALTHAKQGVRGTMPGVAPAAARAGGPVPMPSSGGMRAAPDIMSTQVQEHAPVHTPGPAATQGATATDAEPTVVRKAPIDSEVPRPTPNQEPMLLELAKASPRISWGPPQESAPKAASEAPGPAMPDFDLPPPAPGGMAPGGPPQATREFSVAGAAPGSEEETKHFAQATAQAFGDVGFGNASFTGQPEGDENPGMGGMNADMLFGTAQPEHGIRTRANAPLLVDVTPLSLRVETAGGYSDVLVAAGTPVPCDKTRSFMTARDGQTTVAIKVAQGELVKFADNTFLGELEISGFPPAARGELEIMVTFELDADGILNVKAKERRTGKETSATLKLLGANTDAEDVANMAVRQSEYVVR